VDGSEVTGLLTDLGVTILRLSIPTGISYAMARIAEPSLDIPSPRSKAWKLPLFLFGIPLAIFVTYTWAALHYVYSSGERAGYVQKISLKGWLCKTWEGELAMSTVPGTAPQLFEFSVRSDAVAREIERFAGQRLAISYEQHKGLPTSCFGETEYFVTGARRIGP
jgi:hypothetical protein